MNLKRCLLVSRFPVRGTEKELVLINLHLEAYDNGEGKEAQTRQLVSIMQGEYAKGNYVIAGGDFNQRFTNIDQSAWPVYSGMWQPGTSSFQEMVRIHSVGWICLKFGSKDTSKPWFRKISRKASRCRAT